MNWKGIGEQRKLPIYRVWKTMRERCNNPNSPRFKNYGARGIKVCDRWNTFLNFLADVGDCPIEGYTLDRISNDRGYEPGNVRWASKATQARNQRRKKLSTESAAAIVEMRANTSLSLKQISENFGVSKKMVWVIVNKRNWLPDTDPVAIPGSFP